MMFGQFPGETQNVYNAAQSNPYDPKGPDAGIFSGMGSGAAEGYEAGGAKALLGLSSLKDYVFPGSENTEFEKANVDLINSLNPDPKTVGWVGRQLYGISEVLPTFFAGNLAGGPLGGAALVGGSQANADFRVNKDQGLDATTAAEKAGLTGVTSAGGMLIPFGVGKGVLTKFATGALSNIMFGMGDREANSVLLKAHGYDEMADQYKPLDKASIVSDGILGTVYGGLAALHARGVKSEPPRPSDIDAAMMAKNNQNLEVDSAPGTPINPETRTSHVDAMKTATEQLLKGEPVDVSGVVNGPMSFAVDPKSEIATTHDDLISALRETGYDTEAQQLADSLKEAQSNWEKRTGKLGEVQVKHDTALSEVNSLQEQLSNIQDMRSQPLTRAEQISLVDPISGQRLMEVEKELNDPSTNANRRTQLQAQYDLITEGRSWKEIPAALDARNKEFEAREKELNAEIEARNKDLSRYRDEIYRRQSKLREKETVSHGNPEGTQENADVAPPNDDQIKPKGEEKNVADGEAQHRNTSDLAENIAARKPDMRVATGELVHNGEFDEKGQPIMEPEIISAKEALERDSLHDEATDTAKKMLKAAINCFAQWGTE